MCSNRLYDRKAGGYHIGCKDFRLDICKFHLRDPTRGIEGKAANSGSTCRIFDTGTSFKPKVFAFVLHEQVKITAPRQTDPQFNHGCFQRNV